MSRSAAHVISGRTVVITGAASGIGRALAQRLSSHGCPVAIADVNEVALKETEATLAGPTFTRVLDVRDAAAQSAFAEDVRDWAPVPLGAVFNNAGVAVSSSVLDTVPEDDDWLWDINFHGVVNGTDSTHYSPAGTSTRAQFAKVVVLGFGLDLMTPNGGTATSRSSRSMTIC